MCRTKLSDEIIGILTSSTKGQEFGTENFNFGEFFRT
ncbi:MAG: hypothetical protein BWZ03_00544 [bacterium ADurb.BinA186]|nr:MAG: hypothetical protein BWZ03_00544 [bacterium ADurb.BinA186]